MNTDQSIPVTILSGTLGAGKTTLLNHVLAGEHGYEVAVLVNDMGEVNIDAESVERQLDEEVVELSNGCICCGLQGALSRQVIDLARNHEFDYLLVEPSGISEPAPVAQQFVQGHPSALYELDSVTTVVDARQFYDAFAEGTPQRHGSDESGTRPLSDLIVEGVEFCDAIVLNKTDLVSEDELATVRDSLRTLQPQAEIFPTEFGAIDPGLILGTGRFDPEAVAGSARWQQILDHADSDDHSHTADGDDHTDHDHAHPPEVYGVDSFVYQRAEPMHAERLASFLRESPDTVIRAKGWLHVLGRPDHALELSLAGAEAHVTVAGRWIASLSEDRQDRYRETRDPNWTETYGDRETQLVVIGQEMDQEAVKETLDACVATKAERAQSPAENPFPQQENETARF